MGKKTRQTGESGEQRASLWTRTFIVLTIVQTIDLFTYNMITPLVAKYALSAGAAIADAGLLAGLFTLVAIVVRPVSGFISDRLNRKRLIITTVVGSLVSMIGYALSPNLIAFALFRVMHGLCYAIFGTVVASTVAAALPEERKGEGMGWFSLSYVFASALGPALGVALSDALGFTVLFLIGALCVFVSLVAMRFADIAPNCHAAPARGRRIHLSDFIGLKCLPLALVMACLSYDWGTITGFVVIAGEERNVAGIGLFFTVNALTLFVSRPPAGKFADRHGLTALFYPAIVFEGLAMWLLSFVSTLPAFCVVGALKALGQGTVHPVFQAECTIIEGKERTGVAISTFLLGTDIGAALGPMVGGAIAAHVGYGGMYLSCLVPVALAFVIFTAWLIVRHGRSGFSRIS